MGDFTAIQEPEGNSIIPAYPNPTADRITFSVPVNERILGIELMDVRGATVAVPPAERTIATDALASGLYSARIRTNSGVHVSRFVKQ